MTEFDISVRIAAPKEQVWRVLSRVTEWPQWTPTVEKIEQVGQLQIGIGSQFKVEQPKLRPAVWEVTVWKVNEEFTWVSRVPGMLTVGRHVIEPLANNTEVRLTLSVRFTGLLGSIAALTNGSLVRQYISLEANGLKARCEL